MTYLDLQMFDALSTATYDPKEQSCWAQLGMTSPPPTKKKQKECFFSPDAILETCLYFLHFSLKVSAKI